MIVSTGISCNLYSLRLHIFILLLLGAESKNSRLVSMPQDILPLLWEENYFTYLLQRSAATKLRGTIGT